MKEYKVIGKRIPRVDALEKVTGKAVYSADFSLPGMLWGKVLRSPHVHARIKRIDFAKALALEGVKGVVTVQDLPPIEKATGTTAGEVMIDVRHLRKYLIAHDKVLFHGHPVAAVAAVDPHIAEDALKLIEVEYEVLPFVEDVLDAMKPDAPILHDDLYTKTLGEKSSKPSNIAQHTQMGRGNVEAGFREADVVIENTYRTQRVHQGYIEPQACVASVDPKGMVTVWASSQGSFNTKFQIVDVLHLPWSRVRVVPLEIGGGFGGKIHVMLEPLCVLLARKTGKPVKMVITREEVFRATGPASSSIITLKTGATRDGRLTGISANMIFDAGCFPGGPVTQAILAGLGPYKVPNLNAEGYDVVTNKARTQAYRGPGAPQGAFAMESQMDMMAEALGMDPLEFRRINAVAEGDLAPNDRNYNRIGFKEILEKARTHPAWKDGLKGPNLGRGVACGYWFGVQLASSAHVAVNADGTAALTVGTVDLTGTRTTMLQIAAEELGLSPEEVSVTVGDTESVGYTDLSAGSRTTYSMGATVHRACRDAIAQLKKRAASILKVNEEEVEYENRVFKVKSSSDKSISLKEVAQTTTRRGEGPIVGKGTLARLAPAPSFALHIADVEVDPETGKVKVLKYTAFQDVGFAINPALIEGLMQGAIAQGVGWALTEEYKDSDGVLQNATFLDYRIPTSVDLPSINTEILEVPAPDGPYGARGAGEVPIVPPLAAIANGVYRAIGVRMKVLPMTPEAVLQAVKTRKVAVT